MIKTRENIILYYWQYVCIRVISPNSKVAPSFFKLKLFWVKYHSGVTGLRSGLIMLQDKDQNQAKHERN